MADDDATERALILARRKRFVTATLAGLAGVAGTTLATACPCLKMAPSTPPPSHDDAAKGNAASDADTDAARDTDAAGDSDAAVEQP